MRISKFLHGAGYHIFGGSSNTSGWRLLASQSTCHSQKHTIFTEGAIGIPRFIEKQETVVGTQTTQEVTKFFEDMKRKALQTGPNGLISKDALHKAIFLSSSKEDLDFLNHLTKKYLESSYGLAFGSFQSASANIMRCCYLLDSPDHALQLLQQPATASVFQQPSAAAVAMLLLYRHHRHEEVVASLEAVVAARHHGNPAMCVTLGLAAALKDGGPDLLARALAAASAPISGDSVAGQGLIPPCRENGTVQGLAGLVALALGRPDDALRITHNTKHARLSVVLHVMVRAWLAVGSVEQALSLLRPLVLGQTYFIRPPTLVFRDTLRELERCVEAEQDAVLLQEWRRVERGLLRSGLLCEQDVLSTALQPVVHNAEREAGPYGAQLHRGAEIRRGFLPGRLATRRRGLMPSVEA